MQADTGAGGDEGFEHGGGEGVGVPGRRLWVVGCLEAGLVSISNKRIRLPMYWSLWHVALNATR